MVRAAAQEDVPRIAHIHVTAWLETYAGLIPQEVLDSLPIDERAAMWRRALDEGSATSLLVCEHEGDVVGFAAVGPEREGHTHYTGELYAIYLLQKVHGRGYGAALFQEAMRSLKTAGHSAARLWVLESNPTRGFYEHLGGERLERKMVSMMGATLSEVAYGWSELSDLPPSEGRG